MDKFGFDFVNLIKKVQREPSQPHIEELTSLLRELRTLCASSANIRKSVFDSIELNSLIQTFDQILKIDQSDKTLLCVMIGLQVIGNTVVQNDVQCVLHIWNTAGPFLL